MIYQANTYMKFVLEVHDKERYSGDQRLVARLIVLTAITIQHGGEIGIPTRIPRIP